MGSTIRTHPGDSVVDSSDDERLQKELQDHPSGEPPGDVDRREGVHRDTVPRQFFCERRQADIGARRNDNVGNLSFLFGNWGALPNANTHKHQRRRIELELRHCPALVACFAECEAPMEEFLRRPGAPVPSLAGAPAAAGASAAAAAGDCEALQRRPEYEYLTLRGREQSSLCIAARANLAKRVELLHWERSVDGHYKTGGGKKHQALSRIMVAEVSFDQTYALFQDKVRVCAVHLHRDTAKNSKGFAAAHKAWWPKLADILKQHHVDVLCGDFNMALTQTLPRLRGLGLRIETAAVHFWRSLEGAPCLDSCGIFVLDRPGEYSLRWPLSAVHDKDETGLLFSGKSVIGDGEYRNTSKAEAPAAAGASSSPASEPKYWRHSVNKGPGKPYHCYYPKKDAREHLKDLLTPADDSRAQIQAKAEEKQRRADAEARGDKSLCNTREVLLFRAQQKTLPVETVEVDGCWHGGAHYPLMFNVRMASARSKEKQAARGTAKKARRAQRAQEAALQGDAGAAAAAPQQHGPEQQAPERHRERGEQSDSDWPAVGSGRSWQAG